MYQDKIEKDVVAQLPLCSIQGEIVVIDKPSDVEAAVNTLRQAGIIGFDTETRPSFIKGVSYRISLLQLATETTCYLFRLQKIGANNLLKALLEDRTITKIGLSTRDDSRSLQRWMRCTPDGFVELQSFVKPFGIEEMSLQKIYAIIFNERISKTQQLSNWDLPTLTHAQQQYAAIDAWACLKIYNKLTNEQI